MKLLHVMFLAPRNRWRLRTIWKIYSPSLEY